MTVCFAHNDAATQPISTVVDVLRKRANDQANSLAYRFLQDGETESARFSYRDIDSRAQAIAATLQSLNATGSRVLLIYPPGLDFIAAFFGCLYAGAIAVPAYPPRRNQKLSRLQAIIASSQSTFALTTAALLKRITDDFSIISEATNLAKLHWLATDTIHETASETVSETANKAGSKKATQRWQPPDLSPDSLAFIQYTSGSTGSPKGVMVSHRNIAHNAKLIQQSFASTSKSIGVSWLPPYHDMGLIGCILQPMYAGAPMTLMPPLAFLQQPIRWLQAITHQQATTSGGPNFAYDLCASKVKPEQLETLDLSSWRVAFTGAEPIRAATLSRFAKTFAPCGFRFEAFHPCYGMAETTLIVSGSQPTTAPVVCSLDIAALKGNRVQVVPVADEAFTEETRGDVQAVVGCGQKLQGVDIVIVDPERLALCSADDIGEIWVAADSVARGYWNRPVQTQETFGAWLSDAGDRKGPYLRTGDLGFLREGELFVTGRIKDLMIIRGQNHYPQDVEATVESSHEALRPSAGAVFTMAVAGTEKVVVVQEVKRSYLRKLDVNAAIGDIRTAVSRHHGLQLYAIALIKTGSIPKTSSGKIQRYACRAQFADTALNVVGDWHKAPRSSAKFVHLNAEIDSLLEKMN